MPLNDIIMLSSAIFLAFMSLVYPQLGSFLVILTICLYGIYLDILEELLINLCHLIFFLCFHGYRFPIVEPDLGHTKLRLAREGLEAISRIKNPIAAVSVCLRYFLRF
uniref:Uncharacterized protein n=1 Tax=Rhizophora mucronata TaxID=61149 RepID=A0A2P2MHX4_RHIMU